MDTKRMYVTVMQCFIITELMSRVDGQKYIEYKDVVIPCSHSVNSSNLDELYWNIGSTLVARYIAGAIPPQTTGPLEGRGTLTVPDGNMTISSIFHNDSAVYSCDAYDNGFPTSGATPNISVIVAAQLGTPVILSDNTAEKDELKLPEDFTLVVIATLDGIGEEPSFSWSKNGNPILYDPSVMSKNYASNKMEAILTLRQGSDLLPKGETHQFLCEIELIFATGSRKWEIDVTGDPNIGKYGRAAPTTAALPTTTVEFTTTLPLTSTIAETSTSQSTEATTTEVETTTEPSTTETPPPEPTSTTPTTTTTSTTSPTPTTTTTTATIPTTTTTTPSTNPPDTVDPEIIWNDLYLLPIILGVFALIMAGLAIFKWYRSRSSATDMRDSKNYQDRHDPNQNREQRRPTPKHDQRSNMQRPYTGYNGYQAPNHYQGSRQMSFDRGLTGTHGNHNRATYYGPSGANVL